MWKPLEIGTDLVRALGFLSRIPLPRRYFENHDGTLTRTSGAFALAGAALGLLPALLTGLVLALSGKPELAALCGVAVQIVITGGLHEDGLADCADGVGGGKSKEHALDIMKDSRIGSYGALALILSVLFRIEAIAGVATAAGPYAAMAGIIAVNALSRAMLVLHWTMLPPARPGGVAAAMGQPDTAARNMALATGLIIYAVLTAALVGVGAMVAGLMAAVGACLAINHIAASKIEGHTGDTLGACEQLAQVAALAALAIAA